MNASEPLVPISPAAFFNDSQPDPVVVTAVADQCKASRPALPTSSVRVSFEPACTIKGSDVVLTMSLASDGSSVNCRSALREPRSSLAWMVCCPGDQPGCARIFASNEPVTLTGMELF